jgi:hypothetical protein
MPVVCDAQEQLESGVVLALTSVAERSPQAAMTTLQWIGVVLGLLVICTRLPGALWPEAWTAWVRRHLLARAGAMRALGALLVLSALVILVLIVKTLSLQQAVMLVLAVMLAAGGMISLLFPDAQRRFADEFLRRMSPLGIRVLSWIGVAFGLWIVYLSLSVR